MHTNYTSNSVQEYVFTQPWCTAAVPCCQRQTKQLLRPGKAGPRLYRRISRAQSGHPASKQTCIRQCNALQVTEFLKEMLIQSCFGGSLLLTSDKFKVIDQNYAACTISIIWANSHALLKYVSRQNTAWICQRAIHSVIGQPLILCIQYFLVSAFKLAYVAL